jgi:hypothetical protein
MGATASRSEKILQCEIDVFGETLPLAKRPIDWDNDSSVTAHSTLNTLRNAQYHIQSGHRGQGLRAAAASKLICTGRVASSIVVSFDALAVDITSVTPTTVVPACDVMHCGAIKRHCSAIKRSPSSSSSTCSLDDTCPSSPRARSTAHRPGMPKFSSGRMHADSSGRMRTPVDAGGAEQLCHLELEEGSFQEAEEACDLEFEAFDISAILTSGGRCLTHQVPRSRNY